MNKFINEGSENWAGQQNLPNKAFVCGFCSTKVSSTRGYKIGANSDGSGPLIGGSFLCPNCNGPNFFGPGGNRYPAPAIGNHVKFVPEDLAALYEEARRSSSQSCFTAAVLLSRKMLMNIAVQQGAKEGMRFIEYVNFLSDSGFIPPNGKQWVDHIRKKGNEATHEISIMQEEDARDLITFIEMLLRFVYEFPSMIPSSG